MSRRSFALALPARLLLAGAAALAVACGSEQGATEATAPNPAAIEIGAKRSALVTTLALPISGDTFIRQGIPNQNEGDDLRLSVQINSRHRSLLYFDANAMSAIVGSGTLLSARIELNITENGNDWGATGRSIAIHRMTRASSESAATWNCAFDSNTSNNNSNCTGENAWTMFTTNNGLLPYVPQPTATTVITNGQMGAVSFDVTPDVAAILAGTAVAHGWIIKKLNEGFNASGSLEFASREQGGLSARMLLEVDEGDPCTVTGTVDLCNGVDEDCDGSFDEDFESSATTCGVGACTAAGQTSCVSGSVVDDCAPEQPAENDALCDGIDADCDGVVDEDYDSVATSCGVGACGASGETSCVLGAVVDSCQPGSPAASDASCDGVDDDCDGAADEEYASVSTSCGIGACSAIGVTSCAQGTVTDSCSPGQPAADDSACDGVDSDCDAVVDEDYASVATSCGIGACGATGSTSCVLGGVVDSCQPGSPAPSDASCDAVDDDCDGADDEDYASVSTSCGVGACSATGSTSCAQGVVNDSCSPGQPAADDASCDGIDDDCDAVVDEDYASVSTSCGVGACGASGETSCVLGDVVDSCQPGSPAENDASCDGVDDDCDGGEDEDYAPLTTSCGIGACSATGSTSCVLGEVNDSCTAGEPAENDASCDGVDDDCDEALDEDFVPTCVGTAAQTCSGGVLQTNDCSDGNACNGQETCSGLAVCQPGTPPELDDSDPCTTDSCNPASGPTHELVPIGTSCGPYDQCDASGACVSWLPPDPSEIAPALPSGAVSLLDRERFLFEGADPIQTGVLAGAIQARTAAVLRGQVLDPGGAALPNTTVKVKGHPELGQTLTRIDGAYDLVVNGGGPVTLTFERDGSHPVQRSVVVSWQSDESLDYVALRPIDAAVTALSLPGPAQVHRATPAADDRGSRQPTLYVPSGTQAAIVMPDGTSAPASSLHVRATEFSLGDLGELALPASLPSTVAYAVNLELSADEAAAQGAERVELSQPASLYLENIVALPVGTALPVASLDRASTQWIGQADGVVVGVLGATSGLADLDLDGSGVAAGAEALSAAGFTSEERQTIAQLYAPGTSLVRALVQHTAAFDLGLPFAAPEGTGGVGVDAPALASQTSAEVLSRSVGVADTEYTLTYRSDRVLGSKVGRSLSIPVTAAGAPSLLLGTTLDVQVAGQHVFQAFGAAPSQSTQFTWDAADVEGRTLHGWQRVDVRVGFEFARSYRDPAAFMSSYAQTSPAGASVGAGAAAAVYYRRYQQRLRAFDARQTAIGAWSLNKHHTYDPVARILYRGDGSSRSVDASSLIIDRFAGVAQSGSVGLHNGDGGPALLARMDSPRSLAVGPDGSVYIGTRRGVRRVDPDTQIMTTVAGGKDSVNCNASLEAGVATDLCIFARSLDFGPDGALYIADNPTNSGTVDRIRRLDLATGMISHVAGAPDTTGCSDNGDGGPAVEATICSLIASAVAADGSIYLLDRGTGGAPEAVRKISTNGIIDTIASGNWSASDDSADIDVGPDGSVYITQTRTVTRILPTGEQRHFAGDPSVSGSSGEGGPATLARFGSGGPAGVSVGPDGRVYVGDNGNAQIRMIDQKGIITRIAGTTPSPDAGNGGSPLLASLGIGVVRTAIAPDGTIYLTSRANHTVRVIRPNYAGDFSGEIVVPSPEDGEVYRFDSHGRHLTTSTLVTNGNGTVLSTFGYDASGRLISVTSSAGTTEIERDEDGTPLAIVSPLGAETLLETDDNGYLAGIFPPATAPTELESDPDGLLTRVVDVDGIEHLYSYDSLGRLQP